MREEEEKKTPKKKMNNPSFYDVTWLILETICSATMKTSLVFLSALCCCTSSTTNRPCFVQEYQRLRKEQDKLKIELEEAKKRINVDTNRWSFDLYTAQSFTGKKDRYLDISSEVRRFFYRTY